MLVCLSVWGGVTFNVKLYIYIYIYIYISKTTDGPRASPLGDHMTRKDVKGDQPSGGETTWTNTGATRYGRGHDMAEECVVSICV